MYPKVHWKTGKSERGRGQIFQPLKNGTSAPESNSKDISENEINTFHMEH